MTCRGTRAPSCQTGSNIADITTAASLVSVAKPSAEPVGDKSCDANHLRHVLAERGTTAVVPSTATRKVAVRHDATRPRPRGVIERSFCRTKDFRGIATRCGETARQFLAASLIPSITYGA